MRIYSNTLLSWPQVIHVFQGARLYPGRWLNYYFYKIEHVQPLVLTSYSPMEFLQENCQYYCYDKYYRDKRLEKYGNTRELVSDANQQIWVHIPKVAGATDIIVVRNDSANGFSIPSLFKTPVPVLA
jgi:hypothetical protein